MSILILFGSLAVFFLIGVPIAFSLGLSTMLTIFTMGGLPPIVLIQKLFAGNDSFPLMAIPLFIFSGGLMARGGISRRLVDLAEALTGKLPGGLAVVGVLGCAFFGAISGSPVATVAAIGGVLIPSMVAKGYSRGFCGALFAAAGPLGAMIPPSIALILYGVCAGESVSSLFIATVGPGILMTVCLMITGGWLAVKKGFSRPGEKRDSQVTLGVFWALMMPVIILGGIYGGVFTPTEAAAIAVVFGLLVGLFIYRELKVKDILALLVDSAIGTAAVMMIVNFSTVMSSYLAAQRIPQLVTEGFLAVTQNPLVIILIINVILVIVGTFMDASPAMVIMTPLFLPLVKSLGYSPIHFGIIISTNLLIGLVTPPVGLTLFMGARVSETPVGEVIKELWPFLGAMLLVLIAVNLFPGLSLFLL